jgi:hypothetical protein
LTLLVRYFFVLASGTIALCVVALFVISVLWFLLELSDGFRHEEILRISSMSVVTRPSF